ncbi:MAG: alpha-L-fucosidase [Ignavibacteria bacterium]|jgi:alpha-L-fucosidase
MILKELPTAVKKGLRVILVLLFMIGYNFAQETYTPAPENLKNREWYQDAKFGMFIHWGVYCVLGDAEWVMQVQKIDKKTYQRLATFFNPVEFDAKEWVAIAKAAGMKYITITARHHDGFSMFDSKQTDWDIVDRTLYGKDVIKMLADECHKQSIKLFLYYSHVDWYNDDYYPRGQTGQYSGRSNSGDWNKYIEFINAQLTELLTNYGEIAGIWFDGYWDKPDADWQFEKTYRLIHKLQPQCLIANNHHQAVKPGEDLQTFEKDLPGQNTSGFSAGAEIGQLPLETSETMNRSWGFNLQDHNYKSVKELVQYLVKAAGNNANFLLNVGPMPNGKIQPEFVNKLKEIGKWLDKNGESIYGTRGGPVSPKSWGVTTQKDNKVYVHILSDDNSNLLLPDLGKNIKSIKFLSDGSNVNYKKDEFGIAVQIPDEKIDEFDTILVIEL